MLSFAFVNTIKLIETKHSVECLTANCNTLYTWRMQVVEKKYSRGCVCGVGESRKTDG